MRGSLRSEGVSLVSIDELREKTKRRTGDASKEHARGTGRVVAVAEYRDGTVIDLIEGIGGWRGDARSVCRSERHAGARPFGIGHGW